MLRTFVEMSCDEPTCTVSERSEKPNYNFRFHGWETRTLLDGSVHHRCPWCSGKQYLNRYEDDEDRPCKYCGAELKFRGTFAEGYAAQCSCGRKYELITK